jgi:hypothetical protein
MREPLVRYKYLTPFCRFVIVVASGTRIHVEAPGRLGPFDDERVEYYPPAHGLNDSIATDGLFDHLTDGGPQQVGRKRLWQ